jgi:hypothetical protein
MSAPSPSRGRAPRARGAEARPSTSLFDPAVRPYLVLCLAALGAILLALLEKESGLSTMPLILVGLLGLFARLRMAPLLFLLVLVWQQLLHQLLRSGYGRRWRPAPAWSLEVADVVLCGATVAYVIGHYRLQALLHNVFPLDPRRRVGTARWRFWKIQMLPRIIQEPRSPRLVSQTEVAVFVITLPAAALLAQLFWAGLVQAWPLGFPPALGRFLTLVWVLGVGLLVTAAVLHQVKLRRMTREEAQLLLQDTVWHETRREQRRVSRWLAWARLRERKEPS